MKPFPAKAILLAACMKLPLHAALDPALISLEHTDLEVWLGSGSNRVGLVVDWNDGARVDALAFGYRWDGEASVSNLWEALLMGDVGLSAAFSNGVPQQIDYQRPARTGDQLPGTGKHDVFHTAYAWDHVGGEVEGDWTCWISEEPGGYVFTNFTAVTGPTFAQSLRDDGWILWSFEGPGVGRGRPTRCPMAALNYPFADEVVAYVSGSINTDWDFDWTTFFYSNPDQVETYTHPEVALGRPTVETTGDEDPIPYDEAAVVVPVFQPHRWFELVTIGEGGSLTLRFDHPVQDHPDNPYGLDFLVFGNTFAYQVGMTWSNRNPETTLLGGAGLIDRSKISVSQDGTNWFTFSEGPYGDDYFPTMGRVLDPGNPDDVLPDWNVWWGGPTDPTLPVDPAILPGDLAGYSVADIARRYRGSAGGTGFDISPLSLPLDPESGRKWFRYLRVERQGAALAPEVDAVADVSPALPFDAWRRSGWDWLGDPADEHPTAANQNGVENLVSYVLGCDPHTGNGTNSFALVAGRDGLVIEFETDPVARDVHWEPRTSGDLSADRWDREGLGPLMPLGVEEGRFRWRVPVAGRASRQQFIRMEAEGHEQ